MDIWQNHEIFEIEVLHTLQSARLLDRIIFGGGTMLRLCHELNRYSADLDFWFLRPTTYDTYLKKLVAVIEKNYEVTDAQNKYNTVLTEFRSSRFPRKLKIEIRKGTYRGEYEEIIAFSRFSTHQVLVKSQTLHQTMIQKVSAFFDRGAMRDAYDLEFLLRRGIALPRLSEHQRTEFLKRIASFTPRDFKVTMGSVLEPQSRQYYITHGFRFLVNHLKKQEERTD